MSCHPKRPSSAFTLIELVVCVAITGVLLAVLLPAANRARNGDGLAVSLANVKTIVAANAQYGLDTGGQVAMRGCRYSNGQLNGWDGWSFGGKNCNSYWLTNFGGTFDESAYARTLNRYFARIPVPTGYVNTGSGATWNFRPGTPTPTQRATLQMPTFRSPGDRATYQRSWPNPTPGISGYDDIGTSYVLNMKWWDMATLPSSFTPRYNAGVTLIQTVAPANFVWVHDQLGDLIANSPPTAQIRKGEFGGENRSVCGFLDGACGYVQMTPGASSGPGYTLFPQ